MNKYDGMGEPTRVSRDAGYKIINLLNPENRRKAREKVKNPDYRNSKYKLKELFAKKGIIVNPEAMSYLFRYE